MFVFSIWVWDLGFRVFQIRLGESLVVAHEGLGKGDTIHYGSCLDSRLRQAQIGRLGLRGRFTVVPVAPTSNNP